MFVFLCVCPLVPCAISVYIRTFGSVFFFFFFIRVLGQMKHLLRITEEGRDKKKGREMRPSRGETRTESDRVPEKVKEKEPSI